MADADSNTDVSSARREPSPSPSHSQQAGESQQQQPPKIVTRAATIPPQGAGGSGNRAPSINTGGLAPAPSPQSCSGQQTPSPTGVSPTNSSRLSFHLEDNGISVYTATDRGYTAAEQMHNVFDRPAHDPSNVAEDGQELGQLIDKHVVGRGFKRWLPVDKLFELVNPHSVRKALSRALPERQRSPADLSQYVDKFCSPSVYHDPVTKKQMKRSRRCIFAALALSERVKDAPCFADSEIWDEDLPLERHDTAFGTQLVSRVDQFKRMALPEGWNYRIAQCFEYYQLYMLSPFFDLASQNDVPFHELDDSCVLPFLEDFHGERRQVGHHGTVWKVRIHPAHHNFPARDDDQNPYFAVKELTAKDDDTGVDFTKEVTAWAKSVGVAGHRHIVRLLATWHQNHSWYLLFGWAEGNLRDYWKAHPAGCPHHDLDYRHGQSKWVVEQCLGIAQGLAKIHRATSGHSDDGIIENYGIHGDVKPENILQFKDRDAIHGLLVICDFGFTMFHSRRSRSAASPEGTSPTYRAPEYDVTEKTQGGISRACDVWALGCVYLEFVTWYLLGFDAVDDLFTSRRISEDRGELVASDKFFVYVTLDGPDSIGAIVKPCVHEWIRKLRAHPRCNRLCHDFLDIIEQNLLVVDPKNRIDSYTLAKKLAEIYEKCRGSESYCLTGCPFTEPDSLSSERIIPELMEYDQDAKPEIKQSGRPLDHYDLRARRLICSQDSYPPSVRPLSPVSNSAFGTMSLVNRPTREELRRSENRDETGQPDSDGDETQVARQQTLSGHAQSKHEDMARVVVGSLPKIPELLSEISDASRKTLGNEASEVSSTVRPEGSELGADEDSNEDADQDADQDPDQDPDRDPDTASNTTSKTASTAQHDQVVSQAESQQGVPQEGKPAETVRPAFVNTDAEPHATKPSSKTHVNRQRRASQASMQFDMEFLPNERTPLLDRRDPDLVDLDRAEVDRAIVSRRQSQGQSGQDRQEDRPLAVTTTTTTTTSVVSTQMEREPPMNLENGGVHHQATERNKEQVRRWAGCLLDCFCNPRETIPMTESSDGWTCLGRN